MNGRFHRLRSTKLYLPVWRSATQPLLEDDEMIIWHGTSNNKYYLMIRDKSSQKKVELA